MQKTTTARSRSPVHRWLFAFIVPCHASLKPKWCGRVGAFAGQLQPFDVIVRANGEAVHSVRKFQKICRACTCLNVEVYRVLGVIDAFSCAEWTKEMYVASKDTADRVALKRQKTLQKLQDNSLQTNDGDDTAYSLVGETTEDDGGVSPFTLHQHVAVYPSAELATTGINADSVKSKNVDKLYLEVCAAAVTFP